MLMFLLSIPVCPLKWLLVLALKQYPYWRRCTLEGNLLPLNFRSFLWVMPMNGGWTLFVKLDIFSHFPILPLTLAIYIRICELSYFIIKIIGIMFLTLYGDVYG